jgi:hypothetical protein
VRKLAIVFLLVMTACKRQVVVSSAPSSQPGPSANTNAPGAASHREAVIKFFQAAKVQDVQALANVWGTSNRGPARSFMAPEELEMRVIYMMKCLRHDSYTIMTETPALGDKRVFAVQSKYRSLTAIADFTTTRGPDNRFYLEQFDPAKLNVVCSAS